MKLNSYPNAPGSFEVTQRVEHPRRMQTVLFQTDWEFPSLAQAFGWSLRNVQKEGQTCDHDTTDGTVTCKACGLTASDFISAAYDWLKAHNGKVAIDHGGIMDGDVLEVK